LPRSIRSAGCRSACGSRSRSTRRQRVTALAHSAALRRHADHQSKEGTDGPIRGSGACPGDRRTWNFRPRL
jgi:hypothetical protein